MAVAPWRAGDRITAARLDAMQARWASWTPTWTTSTGANVPAFGNATVTGEYCQTGDAVLFRLEILFGSTTTFGGGGTSDNWYFSVPVTAAATTLINGFGEIFDATASTGSRTAVTTRLATTTYLDIVISSAREDVAAHTNNGVVDAVSPWTWASGDGIRLFGQYRAA